MEQMKSGNVTNFHLSNAYLKRPHLNALLESALNYPLAVVCAGAGYGKTRAVHSFLCESDAHMAWLQISERDNIPTRFWESYTSMISLSWPKIGAQLLAIGFPGTDETFAKYSAMMREIARQPGKHVRVFDDFHLLDNPEVLRFFERASNVLPLNVTLILISRTMPEINMIGMILNERVFTISEDALCFSENEITEYFKQQGLHVTTLNVRNIFEDTQGWAFAVNLIGRSLRKDAKYERCALEAMKANIFRLIEAELTVTISEQLWRFLLRISLIDHLAASLIRELADDEALIKEMQSFHAYIRHDLSLDTYMIHHLFLDYLKQHQNTLADEERKSTCLAAGRWCDANGYHMDAFSYYEKAGNYGAISEKVCGFNVQMPPDMAQYALEIFENAPDEMKFQDPIFPAMHLKTRNSIGKFDDESIALAHKYAEHYEAQPDSPVKNRALTGIYCIWVFLDMFMSTYTDIYDYDAHHKKMRENYDINPFEPIGKYNLVPICAWASLVGTSRAGAQEEYIDSMTRLVPEIASRGKGFFIGFDDLARGELHFYRGQFEKAEQFLRQAVDKAQAFNQYVTLSRSLAYLMRIAFFRGDFAAATENLRAMEPLLSDEDHGARYTIYDIANGYYLLMLGQAEQMPEWLKEDFSPYAHPSFIENYANRIKVQYHYCTGQYAALLAFIENEFERGVLFGKIELRLFQSLCFYKLKRRSDAIAALAEAYELAEPNGLVVIFSQYAKDMRTLTAFALKDGTCPIPKAWLEEINRKASAYAKRLSHMATEYMAVNNIDKEITLTGRESKILRDLSHGLSRSEIAASQNLSVNTVKMVINTIYDRLCVTNLPDAIRIAVDRKIV
ncbi:MAG: LuxR C-terminal-related transcriptional regulator [Oscillospiraceae bacterium]|nr:LuxR C-terminal-related transcriptional regulator [Oscillospiraceae bacterium]